jgi:hypothetical protein
MKLYESYFHLTYQFYPAQQQHVIGASTILFTFLLSRAEELHLIWDQTNGRLLPQETNIHIGSIIMCGSDWNGTSVRTQVIVALSVVLLTL